MLGVSMIIPSLAQYVKSMDGGAMVFGLLMSIYGFIQFFAAPIVGSLSDHYGLPAALFKHTLDIIKVAITDGEEADKRSASIGRLNAAANAGFIIGPVIGGFVSSVPNGFNYTTLLTTVLFGVNYCLVRHHHDVDWRQLLQNAWTKLLGFRDIVNESKSAQTLLVARLLLSMAAILYRTHFSVLLEDKLGMGSKDRGFMLSYMGLLGFFGSFSVGFVTKFVKSERLVLQLSAIIYMGVFFVLSTATTISAVYIMLVPQVISISIIRASSVALQTTFVSQEHVGAFMGISSSLTSISRTVGPILSGWTYTASIDGPAYGAACLAAVSAGLFCFSPHFTKVGNSQVEGKSNRRSKKKAVD
ncbi:Major Facilitator Superfamily (MFS) [Phytophthora infestans T30-4]|uniref:Major Facilitator Superfamily (MFS) n=1 Tax=Phytophthora infestans (strain T30-4) TaxID=403677 RepID=D0RLR1_PHYIT|nr:Major Facilitator Superfamily (MFS) [Phytophthora infestans T30-4]EEY67044.1 Major Facilitator Superfamily (MFS) [Phytophthora infestans T30-4]|eukprot:XP_002909995.1 Major Facilitator Superfamily (MFS) [Phytophthora infestans T30-4]